MTINLLSVSYAGECRFAVCFSDGRAGILDMASYLATRTGPLLAALADENYLKRAFVDAGALAWPNGLEISPERLYDVAAFVKDAA